MNKIGAPSAGHPWPRHLQLPAILCVLIPIVYTAVALIFPPSLYSDPGWGFLVLRSLHNAAPLNTYWTPDPHNIAIDIPKFLGWFSPGQYAIPGIISLSGLPIGSSIALTCGASLASFLFGCVRLSRRFSMSSTSTTLAVLFLSTFRYSTLPFGIYDGGGILLQAAFPWLLLISLRVPEASFLKSAALAFFVLALGFFAKFSGLIVGVAGLTAACLVVLMDQKRVTRGMIGGACGAALALLILIFFWLSKAPTPVTVAHHNDAASGFSFSWIAPWIAGMSPMDLMAWIFRNPQRPVFSDDWPMIVMAAPMSAAMIALLLSGKKTPESREIFRFALIFYLVFAAVLALIFLRGGDVSIDERHVRAPGILFFLAALTILAQYRWIHPVRLVAVSIFIFMSVYGLTSFAARTWAQRSNRHLDAFSRTTQLIISPPAMAFVRSEYARERNSALFVLPSPEIALGLPMGARVLIQQVDFLPLNKLTSLHFAGTTTGCVYIVIQRRLAEQPKGEALRAAFVGYSRDNWAFKDFEDTRVYFQCVALRDPQPASRNGPGAA